MLISNYDRHFFSIIFELEVTVKIDVKNLVY